MNICAFKLRFMTQKCLTLLLLLPVFFFSQQELTLAQTEQLFLHHNLELLAAEYDLSIADAKVVQARIWDLPELSFESNFMRPGVPDFFNLGPTKTLSLEQLFLLGGKRKHEVALAKSDRELATLQFSQLLQQLQAEVRTLFFTIHFENKKLQNIDEQLVYMKDLLKAYRMQTARGNIALRDQVRLQSIVTALSAERLQITVEIAENSSKLRSLAAISSDIVPVMSDEEEKEALQSSPLLSEVELQNLALTHNAGYRIQQKLISNAELQHRLQKSLNIPDLRAGLNYNQSSGVYPNEINFVLSLPLPLWKRNAGNINAAELQIQQAVKQRELAELSLRNAVSAAYARWQKHYDFYHAIPAQEYEDLQAVYRGMTLNFRKGNVTLLDFTDFMESYHQTASQRFETEKQIIISAQELQRLTQTPLFND